MNSIDRKQFNQHLAALNCLSSVDLTSGDIIQTLECIDATLHSLKTINNRQIALLREYLREDDSSSIQSVNPSESRSVNPYDDEDFIDVVTIDSNSNQNCENYENYKNESYSYTIPDWLKYGEPEHAYDTHSESRENLEEECDIHPNVTLRRGKNVNELQQSSYDFLHTFPFVIPSDTNIDQDDNVSMNEDSCGICKVCPPENTGVYTTSCGHLFCTECYHDWATENENTSIRFNCPYCDRHLPKFFHQPAILDTWSHVEEDANPCKKSKYY